MKIKDYLKITHIRRTESLSESEKSMAYISVLKGISIKDLRKMSVGKFEKMTDEVTDMMTIKPSTIKDEYIVGEFDCRLIRKVSDMNAIQFSDLINTIKMKDVELHLATILSILLVPKGCKYPDYNRVKLEESIVENFSISDGMAISSFIKGLSIVSHANILTSLTLNQASVWTRVPKLRRRLARWIVEMLLTSR